MDRYPIRAHFAFFQDVKWFGTSGGGDPTGSYFFVNSQLKAAPHFRRASFMSQSANVRSVEAIRDFRIVLTNFAEEARTALSSAEMEVRRTRDWLTRDQLTFWQAQIKRRNELLSMARTELYRRKLSQQGSDAVSDTEQKEAVRIAQKKLEEAEQRVALIKRWIPVLEHAIAEYHATSQPLGDRLTGSLINGLTLLDRLVGTLEAYLATVAPSAPTFSTELDASSEAGSVASDRGPIAQQETEPSQTVEAEAKPESNEKVTQKAVQGEES